MFLMKEISRRDWTRICLPAGNFPRIGIEGAVLHVQDAFAALDEGALEFEGFVVDVKTDDLPGSGTSTMVWAACREAERPFAIGNGPGP